jgi:hypothetical protein
VIPKLAVFAMTRVTIISLVVVVYFSAYEITNAQDQPPQGKETLCGEDEDIYFSCHLENRKIISVCAKGNFDLGRGYVKYKYGGKNNAFVLPRGDVSPEGNFAITDVSEGSIRGLHLKFITGSYTYVVSSVWPGEIYVVRDGQVIFYQECRASRYKSFSNRIFGGIKQVPPSSVDIH